MPPPSFPLRVTHVATTLQGGAGIGLQRYHHALLQAGVDSRIIVRDAPRVSDGRVAIAARIRHSLIFRLLRRLRLASEPAARFHGRVTRLNRSAKSAPSYELFSSPWTEFAPEAHPWIDAADVVNLHFTAEFVDWGRFTTQVRKPIAFTLHDQGPYLGGFHYARDASANPHLTVLEDELKTLKQRFLSGRRVGVVANSNWNATAAQASGFFPSGAPIQTIYYPLDAQTYRPRDPAAARETFALDRDQLVVGFACEDLGNQRKGFDALLDCLAHLPADLHHATALLSFGRPPPPEQVAQLPFPWTHLGSLESDIAKVAAYSAMDVFVVPSRAEAFGLTALEAAAVGVPVVANPIDGLREAVPAAVEVDAASASERSLRDRLLAQLVPLLRDSNLRQKRRTAGRQRVLDQHDPARIGAQLLAFHQALLA